jgi:hypothetical protein
MHISAWLCLLCLWVSTITGDTSDEGWFFEMHGSYCMMKVYIK